MTKALDIVPTPAPQTRDAGVEFRPARPEDLDTCREIWRDGLNDYLGRMNQPLIPIEADSITRLHGHLRTTDPERFILATRRASDGSERIVGFVSAIRREQLWFLSMLFVRPADQGSGVGRSLLARVLPDDDAILATATDSAQPISNALYASLGMVPRMPLYSAVGRPERRGGFEPLPAGITVEPIAASRYTDDAATAAHVDAIDREILGFARADDHRLLALEGRHGFLYRSGRDTVAYAFASESGRTGPVAALDETLLAPVLGHLLSAIVPRGASAIWAPGAAGDTFVQLLRAGFRLEGSPVLVCWTRPFADFSRYLPISPGLL
jgi:GNAT superfamily N-acetyltransferase